MTTAKYKRPLFAAEFSGARRRYGTGFMKYRDGNLVVNGHGGSVAGYVAGAYFIPESHIGIIFLRNAAGRGFRNAVKSLAALVK